MSGIDGKVVAITGASSGIGEATAIHLAERGAAVVLGARGGDRLGRLAARIADTGGRVAHMRSQINLAESPDVPAAYDAASRMEPAE
jgi:NADP-dependent 3-hydroxy acid dehydrogenase YdfG